MQAFYFLFRIEINQNDDIDKQWEFYDLLALWLYVAEKIDSIFKGIDIPNQSTLSSTGLEIQKAVFFLTNKC